MRHVSHLLLILAASIIQACVSLEPDTGVRNGTEEPLSDELTPVDPTTRFELPEECAPAEKGAKIESRLSLEIDEARLWVGADHGAQPCALALLSRIEDETYRGPSTLALTLAEPAAMPAPSRTRSRLQLFEGARELKSALSSELEPCGAGATRVRFQGAYHGSPIATLDEVSVEGVGVTASACLLQIALGFELGVNPESKNGGVMFHIE